MQICVCVCCIIMISMRISCKKIKYCWNSDLWLWCSDCRMSRGSEKIKVVSCSNGKRWRRPRREKSKRSYRFIDQNTWQQFLQDWNPFSKQNPDILFLQPLRLAGKENRSRRCKKKTKNYHMISLSALSFKQFNNFQFFQSFSIVLILPREWITSCRSNCLDFFGSFYCDQFLSRDEFDGFDTVIKWTREEVGIKEWWEWPVKPEILMFPQFHCH